VPQHHPGFDGRGGRGLERAEGNSLAFDDRGSRGRLGVEAGDSRADQGGKGKEVVQDLSQQGVSSSSGVLSLGGKKFDIPE
jgi:hypothetical protein